jgi:hypothetical protein
MRRLHTGLLARTRAPTASESCCTSAQAAHVQAAASGKGSDEASSPAASSDDHRRRRASGTATPGAVHEHAGTLLWRSYPHGGTGTRHPRYPCRGGRHLATVAGDCGTAQGPHGTPQGAAETEQRPVFPARL